ncbi:hypothetical protein, partial [Fodinicola feengrottensis]|uniref:hypothetical protein n=1 Tax=Fodinicola feengrottensis TaxID=435914 RepID=UPI002442247F
RGLAAELHAALSPEVVVACLEPLAEDVRAIGWDVPVSAPHLDSLIRTLGAYLCSRAPQLAVSGRTLAVRGRAVLVDAAASRGRCHRPRSPSFVS